MRNSGTMVAVAPIRTLSSLSALLSIRLNGTFSLRRLSPDSASTLPSRLRSGRRGDSAFSSVDGVLALAGSAAAVVVGAGALCCARKGGAASRGRHRVTARSIGLTIVASPRWGPKSNGQLHSDETAFIGIDPRKPRNQRPNYHR